MNAVARPAVNTRTLAIAEVLCFATAALSGDKFPIVAICAMLLFWVLNAALCACKAVNHKHALNRALYAVAAASSIAIPIITVAFIVMFGVDISH